MSNFKQTKIVATISDIRCDVDFIKELYDAGINVARLNTAHMDLEGALKEITNIRAVSDKIAILVDTKGPEVRTSGIQEPLDFKAGDKVKIKGGEGVATADCFFVSYKDFVADVPVGSSVLIDDGETALSVVGKTEDALDCVIENSGVIKNRKSVNVPGVTIKLPSITAKDKMFIEFSAENDVDFIAHSFVRNAQDVKDVQKILDAKGSDAKIIAKIENLDGVNNIDEILDHAYGVMVARGDLGIEVPAEKIPGMQRHLIRKCVSRKKPVIIATQMLHTMIDNPRPTRAEVSDVANAIYYRTDAIMLSGETAYGKYPVEAVKTMSRIAREVEASKDRRNDIHVPAIDNEIPAYLAEAAITASRRIVDTKAIVTDSTTGRTARYLAAFRGDIPVFAKCYNKRVMRELALSYGIEADYFEPQKNKDKLVRRALKDLREDGQLQDDDTIVYVGGSFGAGGGSTFMEIEKVGRLTQKRSEEK